MAIKMAGSAPAAESESKTGYLVSPRSDAWLLGGFGIAAWALFSAPGWGLISDIPALAQGPIYWFLLALSGTHFGASYHLAYGQGREVVRERSLLLIGVPVLLALVAGAVTVMGLAGSRDLANAITRFLLVLVFTTTSWHYIKQVYGVGRVGASLNGLKIDKTSTYVLRYGLYPIWFMEGSRVWTGSRQVQFEGRVVSYDLLPSAFATVFEWVARAAAIALIVVFVQLFVRWRRMPATMWTPYAAGFLWFLFTPNYTSLVLVFGSLHGIQYLACAHRAEVSWGRERSAGQPKLWWSSAFGGALATGLLLVYWLPRLLTDASAGTSLGVIPAALLFAFFNLHHYAVDASIWRFGGQHIARIVGKR